jgi:UDP-glucuronate decarboxylase
MRIFLTGGTGFIATSLVSKLKDENEILVYDNFERNAFETTNLKECQTLICVKGDVLDYDRLEDNLVNFDPHIVLHLASIAGVDNVINRPTQTMKVNMIGTYNVLDICCKLENLEQFFNFSTSEVYGSYSYRLGEDEKTTMGVIGEARWAYSVSKLAGEHLAFSFFKEKNLPVVSIRPFNVYGPMQVGQSAIQEFIKRAVKDEDIIIHGDGSQIRSWCYIDDAIDLLLRCLGNTSVIGHVFNMGNPKATVTILDLAKKVIEVTDSKSIIVPVDSPWVDVELRIPNIEKARKLLFYEPKVSLENGILKTAEWWREFYGTNQSIN